MYVKNDIVIRNKHGLHKKFFKKQKEQKKKLKLMYY